MTTGEIRRWETPEKDRMGPRHEWTPELSRCDGNARARQGAGTWQIVSGDSDIGVIPQRLGAQRQGLFQRSRGESKHGFFRKPTSDRKRNGFSLDGS